MQPTFAASVLGILVFTASTVEAQCGGGISWNTVHERVDLLHSLNTSKEVAQPAFFQYTRPDSGAPAGAIAAALKLQACATPAGSIGPFAEYLWNNLSGKRQNALRIGVDGDWQIREVSSSGSSHSPLFLAQINYKTDREKKTESAQSVLQLTWVSRNRGWPAPNATWRPASWIDFTWAPFVGLASEQVLAADDPDAEGTILRALFQVDLIAYPMGVAWSRRLELSSSYAYQHDVADATSEADDEHPMFRAGADETGQLLCRWPFSGPVGHGTPSWIGFERVHLCDTTRQRTAGLRQPMARGL